MPLSHGKSEKAFSHNVEVEVQAGKPQKQAVAIAYAERRRASDEVEISDADVRKHLAAHRRIDALASAHLTVDCADHILTCPGRYGPHPTRIRLALDRAPTMRSKDVNGWLHVRDCNISKANICPYLGKEIPDAGKLGLDDEHIYRLYRDAAALEAAAPSFERVPLMMHHVGVTADNPQKQMIIGTVSNVRWKAPYLVADLTVWDAKGIEAIESERQQELSPGYRYRPEMNSGVLDGDPYDGRMLDILANHVAIVDTGRTGPDVMVKDKAPSA